MNDKPHDPINHPTHYNSHPSGIECISITEHMTFNIGNAIKYLWRAGLKRTFASQQADSELHLQDLKKAAWYVNREIQKIQQAFNIKE